jgi:hypothetical protein
VLLPAPTAVIADDLGQGLTSVVYQRARARQRL